MGTRMRQIRWWLLCGHNLHYMRLVETWRDDYGTIGVHKCSACPRSLVEYVNGVSRWGVGRWMKV